MRDWVKGLARRALLTDGVRRLTLSVANGQVDEQAIAELWLGWGNPQWSATSDMLSVLASHMLRPATRTVLECGSGVSTIVMGIAAEFTGAQVVSLEADAEWHAQMSRTIERFNLRNVDIRHAPIERQAAADWYAAPAVADLSRVDLFVCDGPRGETRGGRSGALAHVVPLLAGNATIVIDDVHRAPERELAARFRDATDGREVQWGRPSRQFAVIDTTAVHAPLADPYADMGVLKAPRSREPAALRIG